MNKRVAAAILFGLSIALLSGCAPWLDGALRVAQDAKNTSDEYDQEIHEERVEELNREYDEFLQSQGQVGTDEDEAEQSIMIIEKDIDND